jgi:hypothetical protein
MFPMLRLRFLFITALAAAPCLAQSKVSFENSEALLFSNDQVELLVATQGGGFLSFTRKDDEKRLNPMWDPAGMARRNNLTSRFGNSKGHFLCVDGFGPVSKAEQAAGYPGHGEAHRQPWEVMQSTKASATFKVQLPVVQETLVRSVTMKPGEPVVMVDSELESHLGFDRVMLWGEHATLGTPFLALGKTVVDQSTIDCQTKPRKGETGPQTFPSGANFKWPKLASPETDMRTSPAAHGTMNHIGCLMDPARPLAFVTAFNSEERLMLGYVWPQQDFPWIQHWMSYPTNGMYSWGLEFGMQPYDMTKQDIVALSPMFGQPAFRWLPAKSKVRAQFLMFLAKVPAGFQHTEAVSIANGRILLEDKTNKQQIAVPFSGAFRQ